MDELVKMFSLTVNLKGSVAAELLGMILTYCLTLASLSLVAYCIAAAVQAGLAQ